MRKKADWKKAQERIQSFCCLKQLTWNIPQIRPHLGIVFVGSQQSGKSTIMGHFLYKIGKIDKRRIERFSKKLLDMKRSTNEKYAWCAGSVTNEEKYRCSTRNLKPFNFQTEKLSFSFFDTPGDPQLIKGTIAGMGLSEICVIVISAQHFAHSSAEDDELQVEELKAIKEIVLISYGMQIKRLIFLVNKLDLVNYSQTIYENIVEIIEDIVKKVGFKKEAVNYIPTSGVIGDNLMEESPNMKWYQGWTLSETILQLKGEKRNISGEKFRMVLHKSYKIGGIGTVLGGKVISGIFKPGHHNHKNVSFMVIRSGSDMSENIIKTVPARGIERVYESLSIALPHDNIGLNIKEAHSRLFKKYDSPQRSCWGQVISHEGECLLPARLILAKVIVIRRKIRVGLQFILYSHTASAPCLIHKIIGKGNEESKEEKSPEFVEVGELGIIELVPKNILLLEKYVDCPRMGSIIMRDQNITHCLGKILNIERINIKNKFAN